MYHADAIIINHHLAELHHSRTVSTGCQRAGHFEAVALILRLGYGSVSLKLGSGCMTTAGVSLVQGQNTGSITLKPSIKSPRVIVWP